MSHWANRTMDAMSARHIPAGERGPWRVAKGARFTSLLYCAQSEPEVVLADHQEELRTHLEFIRRARGRVLTTGLGLGCVLRGLAVGGRIESLTVVEREQDVIELVWPHVGVEARIVHADAISFAETGERFDCAWHDLWSDADRGDPHLQVMHAEVMRAWARQVAWQGAWKIPRWFTRKAYRRKTERRVRCLL